MFLLKNILQKGEKKPWYPTFKKQTIKLYTKYDANSTKERNEDMIELLKELVP